MKSLRFLLICLLFSACAFPKDGAYILPDQYKVQDYADFKTQFKEGKLVYAAHCARCHTKVVDGKKVEPKFIPVNIESYLMRVKPIPHRGQLPPEVLSDDEIKRVALYLHNNHWRDAQAVKR